MSHVGSKDVAMSSNSHEAGDDALPLIHHGRPSGRNVLLISGPGGVTAVLCTVVWDAIDACSYSAVMA